MPIRPISKELQKKAEEELNEVPSRIQDDLKHILEWLQKQPHLNIRTDEQLFVNFLRACKFSLQRTKEKLDYFYTMRTIVPEFFRKRDPLLPEIQDYLKKGAVLPLPKTEDSTGPRIILIRMYQCEINTMLFVDLLRVFFMVLDILMLEDDNCIISGIHIVADFKDYSMSYMLQYTPHLLQRTVQCIQNAYPLRIKGIECLNIPSVFEKILTLIRTFMSDKLKRRFNGYGSESVNDFYKTFPKYLLPKECGGETGSLTELTDEWKKKVESYREWYVEDEQYGTKEKLRSGQPKLSSESFGAEGTFRKINLD